MKRNSTKRFHLLFALCLIGLLPLLTATGLFAQANSTPVITVDLTGKPNGIWTSADITRQGQVCGAGKQEECVQFNITLDKNAGGLEFDIASGPVPQGAMSYRVDCGDPVPVGQPICVSGAGPHVLTICMPGGGAKNTYIVKSIAAFTPQLDVSVTTGCTATLHAPVAFEEASITWTDITGGGAYNKYLSCTTGCANPTVTPDADAPAYVDYVVCGSSVTSPCSTLPFCDTIRVYLYPPAEITIGPYPAIICPGNSSVELSGTVTGGDGNFDYIWTDSNGKEVSYLPTYTATAVGTYTLEVRNKNYPYCQKFSGSVDVVTDLTVNAGPDQLVCASNPVKLAGVVTAATGGVWSGGGGTFSDRADLNAVYIPSAAELDAGFVRLTLTSTGNGSCTAVQDEVLISFYNMQVMLAGSSVICNGTLASITASVTGGRGAVTYRWSTGETTAAIHNKPAGTYTVSVSDGLGCVVEKSFTVTAVTGPSAFAATLKPSSCGTANGEITVGTVTGGTAPYNYSKDGATFQASPVFAALAAGSYTITVKDTNGCSFASAYTLSDVAGPTAVAATALSAGCANNDGGISLGEVTGGTAPYTYSINGTTFQSGTSFTALASGTYTVTARDANGCLITTSVTVGKLQPTAFTASVAAATCGNSNGSITVGAVTGGTAPYTYSRNGTTFQTAATLTGFAAGTYTITVKDARGCTVAQQVAVSNIAGPADLAAAVKSSTCGNSNGEATITGVTGGTAPYTYSKDGSSFQATATFTGLAAGNHTIYVKDANGCVFSKAITVSDIAGPAAVAVSSQPAGCADNEGRIAVGVVTGGTAPFTYSINGTSYQTATTFTGLAAGTYTVRAKDSNGCQVTASVTVGKTVPTAFTASAVSSTCGSSNGSIAVSAVTGGTAPYTYSRDGVNFQTSATFSGLAQATYTVTVKDANGCTFARTVTVNNIAGPNDLTASVSASKCGGPNGGFTISAVTGGTQPFTFSTDGTTYQSAGTFASLPAGEYQVRVKDANGCVYTEAVVIQDIAGPTLSVVAQSATCGNSNGQISITVSGGTAPFSYSKDGTTFQAGAAFGNLAAGTYTISVKDANNCLQTASVAVNNIAGPSNLNLATSSSTCGNSNGSISINGVTGGTAPYAYAMEGGNFQSATTFGSLQAREYTITVRDANGCTFSGKVAVSNSAGPTDLTAAVTASTCGAGNGQLSVSGVTGGTAPYTYSLNGGNFQSSAAFTALAAGTYTVSVKDANGCTFAKQVVVNNIAGPTDFTAQVQKTSCGRNNGSIRVSAVAGGTAPYSYSKDGATFQASDTFAALVAGTYTITVKDANGCVVAKTVAVEDVAGPDSFTLTAASSTCGNSNGSVTVGTVTGGTAPYTYSRNGTTFQTGTSFTGLAVGTHTITVKDANGCILAMQVTVTNVAGPADITAAVKSSTCGAGNGELAVTNITGGTAPYTYSKDGVNFQAAATFAALAAGQYTITVRDANGCTFAKAFTVSNIAGPTAVTATTQPAGCADNDGSIAVGVVTGGTAPFIYSINGTSFQSGTSFAALASGTYTVTARDANGCLTTTTVIVTKNIPTNFASSTAPSTCGNSNGSITVGTVTGGTGPYTYSKDGTSFQAAATFAGLSAGTHTITVKDARGCTFAKQVAVSNIAGPADLAATVKSAACGGSDGAFSVTVTGGTAPYTYSIDGSSFQSSNTFAALLAGTYTVHIRDANGCSYSETVVVPDIAGPTFTAVAQAATCGNSNGSITAGEVTGGTAPYTYSRDGVNFQSSSAFTALAAGAYNISVKDAGGCVRTKSVVVENVAGPEELILASQASTCGKSNGGISVNGVTGGTAPYTYALGSTTFQSATSFASLPAGEYTVTVKDANGCTFAGKVMVEDIAGPADMAAATTSATCGGSNGELAVTVVTGGTAPYAYSRDGVNFQQAAAFTGLAAGQHTITVRDANGCIFDKVFTINNIAGPAAVAASAVQASCLDNDGRISIGTVTGGTAPYTYSINSTAFQSETTFAGLASGVYTVTAKDANGCVVSSSVNVGRNVPTTFASSTVSSTCGDRNGSLTVGTVTGGTAPFTYSKDGVNFQASATLTGLAAGTHTITVKDAKGCAVTRQVQVTDVAGPSDLVAAVTASTCGASNGRITINGVAGGTAPYTYSKDGLNFQETATFTALAAGTYLITVKDANGCTFAEEAAVGNVAGPDFAVTAQATTCGNSNGSITAGEVTGGVAPYTYSLDGTTFGSGSAFTGLPAAVYTITVKDANGCIQAKDVEVQHITGPDGLNLASTSATCGSANGSVLVTGVTGGTAPYTYALDGATFRNGTAFGELTAGNYTITVKDANGCMFAKTVAVENVAGPNGIAASAAASTCGSSNGELTVTGVTGGTAPYTYSRDGVNFQQTAAFTGLAAGQHTITVKDANGCTFARTFTISNTAGPAAVAATSQPATCADNNGSIAVGVVTGGTAPYSYSINGADFQTSTNFTALASGAYTVTARDANGCAVTAQVTVEQNVPVAFASSVAAATCDRSDGSITVGAVTGGTAPYVYSIDGTAFQAAATFEGLAAGTYTIAVKDINGCTFAREVAVSNAAGPTFTATVQPTTCGNSNGSIQLSAVTGGTGPYTFSKDGSNFQSAMVFGNLQAGTYTITAKDANGCLGTSTVELIDITGPDGFELAVNPSTCGNSNAGITISGVTGGTAPYTYSKDGVNFQAAATFTALADGTYSITVKDANGCVFTKAVEAENIAGPDGLTLATEASTCGGNSGAIKVEGVTGGTAPYLYSMDGTTFQQEAAFSALGAGEYGISVKDANGCTFTRKVRVDNIGGPSDLTADAVASTCGASNGQLTVTAVTGGTAPYTYSIDGVNFRASVAFTGLPAGQHTITVKDANGCTFAKVITVTDIAGPAAVAAATQPASCTDNDGSIAVGVVTGGTAPFTYSINGTSFQSGTTFIALASGNYTVTARDANGCEVTASVTINKNVPTHFTATTVAAACGNSNGSITVGTVTGGTAPYTYSVNGSGFQAAATFAGLAADTHTVTIKDASGCTYSAQVQVADVAGPSALTAAVVSSTCGSSNGQFTVSEVTGGTAPFAYSINGTDFQTSAAFTALPAGTYQVTVRDANGCSFKEAVAVGDIPGPSAFTAVPHASSCGRSNGSIAVETVTGGTAPYLYSKDGVNFQASATFSAQAAGEYTITVKDANGCVVSGLVVLEDVAGPDDLELAAVASTCGGSNGTIRVEGVTGGKAPYFFSINGTDFQSATSFEAVPAGEHTVTVKDANSCMFAKKVTVGNVAGPADMAVTMQPSVCGGGNGALAVTGITGGTAPYFYSKDGVNFQEDAAFSALAAGQHLITVRDANGCIFSKTFTVTDIAGPAAVAAATQPASCNNNDGSIAVGVVTGGTAPFTYSINGTSFQSGTTFTALASGDYTLTVKDANGCMTTAAVIVGMNVPVSFTSSVTSSACGNSNGSITAGEVTGGTAPYTYSMDGINYQTASVFSGLAPGEYNIYVKDANGCTTAAAVAVKTEEPREAVVTSAAATCGQSNGSITVSSVTGGTLPLSYSLDGNIYQSSATFGNLAAGSYTVTIRDAAGCMLSVSKEVLPGGGAVAFTATTTDASCGSKNGSIRISQVSGGQSPYTYSIDGTAFQTSSEFSNLAEGTYQVWVKDALGCVKVETAAIKNNSSITDVKFSVGPAGCGSATGQVVVGEVTGGTAPYTYALGGVNFSGSATFSGVAPGTYQLSVKDATGCITSVPVKVTGVASALAAVQHVSCAGEANGSIAITTTGKTGQPEFSIDNGLTFRKDSVFTNLPKGIYQVITRFSAGCSVTLGTVEVKEPVKLLATVTPLSKTATNANSGSASAAVSGGTAPYIYQLDKGTFGTASVFHNLSGGIHALVVKDSNGCTTEVSFTIETQTFTGDPEDEISTLEFPNGFTPNGDGINDRWVLRNLSLLYPNCKVRVYNGWGSLVFESVGYKQEWDGTQNGKRLPDGTYYCVIEFGNTLPPVKKSVTIMR